MSLEMISSNKSFGGWQKRYRHASRVLDCDMQFSVYLPPQAEQGASLPVLYWLSGLTCTDENFMHKAGAQRMAAELGLVIEGAAGLGLQSCLLGELPHVRIDQRGAVGKHDDR